MHPDILYLEISGAQQSLVEDWETYYALRCKYAIDFNSLHGDITLYLQNNATNKDFWQEKMNAKLAGLFENDVKEFSMRGAEAFSGIFSEYNISMIRQPFSGQLFEKMQAG